MCVCWGLRIQFLIYSRPPTVSLTMVCNCLQTLQLTQSNTSSTPYYYWYSASSERDDCLALSMVAWRFLKNSSFGQFHTRQRASLGAQQYTYHDIVASRSNTGVYKSHKLGLNEVKVHLFSGTKAFCPEVPSLMFEMFLSLLQGNISGQPCLFFTWSSA